MDFPPVRYNCSAVTAAPPTTSAAGVWSNLVFYLSTISVDWRRNSHPKPARGERFVVHRKPVDLPHHHPILPHLFTGETSALVPNTNFTILTF